MDSAPAIAFDPKFQVLLRRETTDVLCSRPGRTSPIRTEHMIKCFANSWRETFVLHHFIDNFPSFLLSKGLRGLSKRLSQILVHGHAPRVLRHKRSFRETINTIELESI